MFAVPHVLVAVLAYLLGSIPTGFLVGKAKGIDVRKVGSGNIGATNAFRILGKAAGSFVLMADAMKGYLACKILAAGIAQMGVVSDVATLQEQLPITAGVCAVLGHNFTCWLKFKGGKGIATSAGVLVAWVPLALLIIFATWLVVFGSSRYVSLASIAAAVVLPFAVWGTGGGTTFIVITSALSALAIYKHKPNIRRLLDGTENRVGSNKTSPTSAQ